MLALPALLVGMELVYFSQVKDMAPFQVFSGQKKNELSEVNVTYVAVHLIVFLTGIILYGRIELGHVAQQYGGGCLFMMRNCFTPSGKECIMTYNMAFLRVVLAIGCGLAFLSIHGAYFAVDSSDHRNNVLLYHILLISALPSWLVYNDHSFWALAKKQLLPPKNHL